MRYRVENLNSVQLETELNCQAAEGFELVQIIGSGTDKVRAILKNPSLPPIDEVKDDKPKGEDNA